MTAKQARGRSSSLPTYLYPGMCNLNPFTYVIHGEPHSCTAAESWVIDDNANGHASFILKNKNKFIKTQGKDLVVRATLL